MSEKKKRYSLTNYCCSGNLTRDPELLHTNHGKPVLKFGVAVNYGTHVGFWRCKIFGSRAESQSKVLKKGMGVILGGRLEPYTWERDGQTRRDWDFVVNECVITRWPSDGGGREPRGYSGEGGGGQVAGGPDVDGPPLDDDYGF